MAGAERRGEEGERQRRASFLPEKNAEYLLPHYWDERFKEEDDYDWFKKYEDFRHLLLRHVHADNRVLVVGCGNSGLSEDLYRDGVRKITSTDLSSVVVDRMRTRCLTNGCEGIRWEVADMLQLPYQAASYDVVIEKGAMDVLFVDNESPWNPSEAVQQRVQAMLGEVHRVLTDKGLFISVTFGQPHFRRPLFERASFTWSMKVKRACMQGLLFPIQRLSSLSSCAEIL